MPVVTVTGAGADCTVSSRFSGRYAHAAARSFLSRHPLAGVRVLEEGQALAGFAFEAVARQQTVAREGARARRKNNLIVGS